MHGHRHVDWIGTCGGLLIVSAPSPVIAPRDSTRAHFHIHTLSLGDGRLALLQPQYRQLGVKLLSLIAQEGIDSEFYRPRD